MIHLQKNVTATQDEILVESLDGHDLIEVTSLRLRELIASQCNVPQHNGTMHIFYMN